MQPLHTFSGSNNRPLRPAPIIPSSSVSFITIKTPLKARPPAVPSTPVDTCVCNQPKWPWFHILAAPFCTFGCMSSQVQSRGRCMIDWKWKSGVWKQLSLLASLLIQAASRLVCWFAGLGDECSRRMLGGTPTVFHANSRWETTPSLSMTWCIPLARVHVNNFFYLPFLTPSQSFSAPSTVCKWTLKCHYWMLCYGWRVLH